MAIKASKKVTDRVIKALGGAGKDLSEARINHIMKQKNLFGQTTEKIAEEVAEHVGKNKYVKVGNTKNLKVFGKAYKEDVSDFAKKEFSDLLEEEFYGKGAKISTAKEIGVKIGDKKIMTKLDVNITNDNKENIADILSAEKSYIKEYTKAKESFYKEKSGPKIKTQTKEEKLKYIDDQMREAGMRGLSGDRPDGKQISTKSLKGKMYDSGDDYMRYNAAKEHDEALKILELKDKNPEKFEQKAKSNPLLNKMKGDRENYNHITRRKVEADRMEAIKNASQDQMGLMDHMGYHRVPQRVATGVGTFWLVNKLAEGNGQQTNAQLYGQQPY